jgi:trk system potassium uptake protein TrkH
MKKRKILRDLKASFYYTGKVLNAFSFVLILPLFVAVLFKEWYMFFVFLLTIGVSLLLGSFFELLFKTTKELNWLSGMLIVVITWLVAVLISAIPCYLSGFYGSYLDSIFDAMSGYTTTGLSVIQDLDHAPYSLHTWLHLMQYVGGQGIIVLALIFLARGLKGAIKSYLGEAREDRLWPNIKATAASIWKIANVYAFIGTTALFVVFLNQDIEPVDSFFHALWITMSGWATGGFAPSSLSVIAYHSLLAEILIMLILFVGSMNFAVHFAVWRGKITELFKNIELRAYLVYFLFSYLIVIFGLIAKNFYHGTVANFRLAAFQTISAVTGTGYFNVIPNIVVGYWGELAIFGLTLAMAFGPCSCSTAGGIKGIRVALNIKGVYHEIKRIISPDNSIVITYYHHLRKQILTDNQVKMSALITIAYVCTYLIGAIAGSYLGYPFLLSLFESVSATANVGLTAGITSSMMPTVLKVIYIFQMWLGRLEFTALLVLIGYALVLIRGK